METANQQRAEQTRQEIREQERIRRAQRFNINISTTEWYMIMRPLERLKPNEMTPQERAFLKFLRDLPEMAKNGNHKFLFKSPGAGKRVRKPRPVKAPSTIKPASKLAKKAQKAKKYGGGRNRAQRYDPEAEKERIKKLKRKPKKAATKKTTSSKKATTAKKTTTNKPPKKRRASWRGI